MPEYITLVTRNRIIDALTSADGATFGRGVLPSYLMKRRWFSAKDQTIKSTRFKYLAPLPDGEREIILAEIEPKASGDATRGAGRRGAAPGGAGSCGFGCAGRMSRGRHCRASSRWHACGADGAPAC